MKFFPLFPLLFPPSLPLLYARHWQLVCWSRPARCPAFVLFPRFSRLINLQWTISCYSDSFYISTRGVTAVAKGPISPRRSWTLVFALSTIAADHDRATGHHVPCCRVRLRQEGDRSAVSVSSSPLFAALQFLFL